MIGDDCLCDLPPPISSAVGSTWTCHDCQKTWQLRSLAEMAEEKPYAHQKTYDILRKRRPDGDILVWTTSRKDN